MCMCVDVISHMTHAIFISLCFIFILFFALGKFIALPAGNLSQAGLPLFILSSLMCFTLKLIFSSAPFYKIIVPTVDTVRYEYLVRLLLGNGFPVLLIGPVGTGKTSTAQSALESLDNTKFLRLVINMSAQTTSNNVQVGIYCIYIYTPCIIYILAFEETRCTRAFTLKWNLYSVELDVIKIKIKNRTCVLLFFFFLQHIGGRGESIREAHQGSVRAGWR